MPLSRLELFQEPVTKAKYQNRRCFHHSYHSGNYERLRSSGQEPETETEIYISYHVPMSQEKGQIGYTRQGGVLGRERSLSSQFCS